MVQPHSRPPQGGGSSGWLDCRLLAEFCTKQNTLEFILQKYILFAFNGLLGYPQGHDAEECKSLSDSGKSMCTRSLARKTQSQRVVEIYGKAQPGLGAGLAK